jgi:cytochrome c
MDSLELNKIVGAILVGGLVALVSGLIAGKLVAPRHATQTAMTVPEGKAGAGAAPEQPQKLESVVPLLASADLKAGEASFKKCMSCHTIEKGGPNKVGPNLWGVVGNKHAHKDDFSYSDAIKNKPGIWDYDALNAWLDSPKTYAPGTKMTFAGIKKTEERANLIAWLRTQSDSPLPLPDQAAIDAAKAQAAAATESAEKPAGGEAASGATSGTTAAAASGAAPAPGQEQAAPAGGQTAAAPAASITDLLKTADVNAGQQSAKKCMACHTFDKGGPNKVGPNLYGIVGNKHAHKDDFNYSDAMKSTGGQWTYEALDQFLTSPKQVVPGTKMTFAGVKKPDERANIIAYLRTLSDSPVPLP